MAERGSSAWRSQFWGPPCPRAEIVEFALYAGAPRVWVHRLMRPAFTVLGAVLLKHRYPVRRAGGYNCRAITGGTSYSSHAWGISLDINDDTNPYRRDRLITDMPLAMREEIEAIRTVDGVLVFRGGWDWDGRPETPHSNYDAMHIECIATPDELSAGFIVELPNSITDTLALPVIRRGARGPLVIFLQDLLRMKRTSGDGIFGPRTEEAVRSYQRRHGLESDGIVGHATWTALISAQPPVGAGAPSPQKLTQ